MYPPLPKSHKQAYPFKIAAPSYIYPDHIVPNVRMLAPYIDEIELLLFESSREDSFPAVSDIDILAKIAETSDLTYHVHLPTDVSLTALAPQTQAEAVNAIQRAVELTRPLSPSTYTLHLPYEEDSRTDEAVQRWQQRVYRSMERLGSLLPDSSWFSIETLDYPIEWAENVIADFHLSVCLDIGHLIRYGLDMNAVFNRFRERICLIHLSGVENGRDHVALNRMSDDLMRTVINILKQFHGVVSLEVFSYQDLRASLEVIHYIFG